jgi:hypothetical protein
MASGRRSTVFNNEQGGHVPDLLVFGLQNRIHGAVMNLFMPNLSVLMPPWKEGQLEPHVFRHEPNTRCSYRISDEFLREYLGPVQDILTLVSLLSRVGNIGSQPHCKITEIQRSDRNTAFIREQPGGASVRLQDYINEDNHLQIFKKMVTHMSAVMEASGIFFVAAYQPDNWYVVGGEVIYWPGHLMSDHALRFRKEGIVQIEFRRGSSKMVLKTSPNYTDQVIICCLALCTNLCGKPFQSFVGNSLTSKTISI